MKKLFTAIRSSDLEMVRQLIEKKPALANCVAKQPPKKDDGQSPLQVALKTGNIAIANYVMCCRWNTNDTHMGFRVFSTKERAVEALAVLKRMLAMGADVNALDSYGNSGLNRFALQAKQILPSYNYAEHREGTDRIFTDELHEDLKAVLQALKDSGADATYKAPNLGYSVRQFCSEGSIAILFDEVFS